MRVAAVTQGRLEIEDRPDPDPGVGELLIHVRAAGINNADLIQRAGHYPAPPGAPPDVPGLECAGETGDGRRVMALLGGGGHADSAVVDERHVLDVPDGVGWPEAGGFMEAFATAHDALFTQAGLKGGDRLLVTGAAGGVGLAAVQLGLATGAHVTASARHHHDELRALGADTEIDGAYDVILELVGGDNLALNPGLLAAGGRITVIGLSAGRTATLDFGVLMAKRARIFNSTLRARSADEKAAVVAGLLDDVLPLLANGTVRVFVDRTFPLVEAQQGYEAFRAGGKLGKLVLLS